MCVPSGITEGSTATTPQPTGSPVAVLPGSAYPVAETKIVRPPAAGAVEANVVAAGAIADGDGRIGRAGSGSPGKLLGLEPGGVRLCEEG